MNKKEKMNIKLAKYFGFTEYLDEKFPAQWNFPSDFPLNQCTMPNYIIPDFVKMLEDHMELIAEYTRSGYPREWFND